MKQKLYDCSDLEGPGHVPNQKFTVNTPIGIEVFCIHCGLRGNWQGNKWGYGVVWK